MTPYQLDCILNGVPVYINRRTDGSVYATLHDHGRFGVVPVEVVRVWLRPTSGPSEVLGHTDVVAALKRHGATP